MQFIYLATKPKQTSSKPTTIAGAFQARHSFEALHNARILAGERGAETRFINIIKL